MPAAVDLVTHGSGEGMYYCLNAMASLFHGGRGSFIGGLIILTGMFGVSYSSLRMVREFNLVVPINWFVGYILLLTALTVPKANVIIIDRITGFRMPVANVPYLFAIPAGYFSQIGDLLAEKADQCFSVPASWRGPNDTGSKKSFSEVIRYREHGVAMTAKLVANASHFNFISYDMANNMREFVKECVYYDLALGKYTVDDLQNSENIWALVNEKPSPHGGMFYRSKAGKKVKTEWLSCKEGAAKLDAAWNNEITHAKSFYGKKLFPYALTHANKNPSNLLEENLVNAYEYLTGISKSADYFMQQNIMRNAVEDGFLTKAQEDSAAASVQSYAVAKAEAQQEAAYAIQGGLAQKSVAVMKIVIEIIFMGMFPFVAIVAAIPMCGSVLRTYFVGLMWLQSWAPLYSIINMIVTVYSRGDAMSASATLNGNALTFDTIPSLGSSSAAVAKYAGYAMMSVPFLSWGLFRYGGGALSQMASHWGHPAQAAAGSAANEITTGNISQGSRQFDVEGRSNATRFKEDENAMVASGASSFQSSTGGMVTITPDGGGVINRTGEISKLGIGINSREDIASSFGDLAQSSLSSARTASEGYQKSMSSAYNQVQDYRNARAQALSNDSSIGNETSAGMNKSFSKLDDVIGSYMKSHGVDKETAVRDLSAGTTKTGGSVSVGTEDMPVVGNVLNAFGVKAEAHLGHEHEWRNEKSTSDSIKEHESIDQRTQETKQFREAMETANRAIQSDTLRNSDSATKSFADGVSTQLAQADNYRRDLNNSLTNAKTYQESAQLVRTNGFGVSEDLSQDFVDWASHKQDQHGFVMGIGGVQEALQDPGQRRALVAEYLKGHTDQVLEQFGVNKLHDRAGVEQHYEGNTDRAPRENSIYDSDQEYGRNIANKVNRNKLDVPIDTSVRDKAEQTLKQSQPNIEQQHSDIQSKINETHEPRKVIEDRIINSRADTNNNESSQEQRGAPSIEKNDNWQIMKPQTRQQNVPLMERNQEKHTKSNNTKSVNIETNDSTVKFEKGGK